MTTTSPKVLKDFIPDSKCPIVFDNLPVKFYASWQDWEECAWTVIFDLHGDLFVENYRYSVMAEDNTYNFDPQFITFDDVMDLVKDWREEESNNPGTIEVDLL